MATAAEPQTGTPRTTSSSRIRVGVSSCLLGQEVRFDGGHKRDRFLTDQLGDFVEWVPVCPEVEVGMGTPRPSVRLERRGDEVRLLEPRSGHDHTEAMRAWAVQRSAQLERFDLCGYVLKKDSPSCGMERVRIHNAKGMPEKVGRGLFASVLIETHPLLPVEEEGRLHDPRLRENFVERIFASRRLRTLFAGDWTRNDAIVFHTRHKLQLLAHSEEGYRALGRLVAAISELPREAFQRRYERDFMDVLGLRATARRTANVLQHMAGFVRRHLDRDSRAELAAMIDDYRTGLVPLSVPLALLGHHVRKHGVRYLQDQAFLDPYPRELMLRNQV